MATIPAIKTVGINSIIEIVAAGRNFGYDNVTCSEFRDIIIESIKNGFSTDSYTEILEKGNNETVKSLIYTAVRHNEFLNLFSEKTGIPTTQLIEELNNIVLTKKLYIEVPSLDTSIEQLNSLAEAELISLFHVEHVKSIDVDFVKKYHSMLDMRNLLRVSKNDEVTKEVAKILE